MPQIDVAAGGSEPMVATLPRALNPRHSYSDSFAPTQLAPSISALAVRASPFRNNSILPEILYTNADSIPVSSSGRCIHPDQPDDQPPDFPRNNPGPALFCLTVSLLRHFVPDIRAGNRIRHRVLGPFTPFAVISVISANPPQRDSLALRVDNVLIFYKT